MAKYEEYVEYVNKHILLVGEAWEKMKRCKGFPYASDETFKAMVDTFIANHDNSKFSDEELAAYAVHFYPDEGEVEVKGEFEEAWSHHVKMNPHHWQWWVAEDGVRVVNNYLRNMFLCEMVCDWMAMGVTKGNTASSYYKSIKDKIVLDSYARVFTELLLRVVDPEEWEDETSSI